LPPVSFARLTKQDIGTVAGGKDRRRYKPSCRKWDIN